MGGILALHVATTQRAAIERVVLIDACLLRASALLQHPYGAAGDIPLAVNLSAQFAASLVPLSSAMTSLLAGNSILRRLTLWPFVKDPASLDPSLLREVLRSTGGLSGVLAAFRIGRATTLPEVLQSVEQPVDLVWGENDRLLDRADIEECNRLLRVGEQHVIKDCGHWPMVEKPDELASFLCEERRR
jgi:pimeloyl-ACP methyl ester carboxylesterase